MENNKFVGPGKVFETEEEEFAEYIEMLERPIRCSTINSPLSLPRILLFLQRL
jgi:hypothetical protein